MNDERWDEEEGPRIGPVAERLGLSPRMVRYLEAQGVVRPERGPDPHGHRRYPPPELELAAAAARAIEAGHPTATLRALRDMATRRVAVVRAEPDPLAWFEALALTRAVELAVRPPGPAQPPEAGPHRRRQPRS